MDKKLILVAAPPACGKNYVSELICRSLNNVAYFDKDDLSPLIRRSFELCRERVDMDGEFYLNNLRDAEYAALINLAFSSLRFSSCVIVNAPFLKEVYDLEYMRGLKQKANRLDAELVLVWVSASDNTRFLRMKSRSSDRDVYKLANWDEYVKKSNYGIPTDLTSHMSIDKLYVFDNDNENVAEGSLNNLLSLLGDKNA